MTINRKISISSAVAVAVLLVGSWWLLNRNESEAPLQTTDDAYVRADSTAVSPRVSGTLTHVFIDENRRVHVGDPLMTIDDRDLQVTLDASNAQVGAARANISSLKAQIARQASLHQQARAGISADDANLILAIANQKRYANLALDGSASVQAKQQADAQLHVQQANRERSEANLRAVSQQTEVLRAELQRANASLAQAEAARAAAELNLSYTRITAPVNGVVAQNGARVGAYVTTAKPLLAIVPLDAVYIEANYRETQFARVRVGQAVEIRIDSLPGVILHGRVASLGPATGASFSPVAPHNATGNFTKIVQRLPIRISINPDQADAARLRVGMSVIPTIHTDG